MLLVHAHPDDESIATGATMAYYVASGAAVTLLTCTLGEEGEILVPELAQLAAGEANQLGGLRISELADAMRALGVADHRYLGGPGRFRDSGMMGTPSNDHPRAFWRAASDPAVFDAAVSVAVEVIREVRPQVMITYDDNGDYGHPDHIMAHRVATAAAQAAADPAYGDGQPWQVSKFYWTAVPKSLLRLGVEALKDSPVNFGVASVDDLPFGVEDAQISTAVDATGYGAAKMEALAAHRTQISVDGVFFALSNMLGREILATEHYRLVRGELGPERDADGRETDLFAGLVSRIDDSAGWAWVGVALLCCCAVLAAVLAVFLVPLYAGSVLVPVAVPIAVATNVVLPRLARALIQTPPATLAPFLSWLLAVIVVGVLPRPEGDVVLPGGQGALQWVSYGVLLGGALTGTVTVVLSGARRPARLDQLRR